MPLDPWLPVGHELPDRAVVRRPLFEGREWQIVQTDGDGRALLTVEGLQRRWVNAGLVEAGALTSFEFGEERFFSLSCRPSQHLSPITEATGPRDPSDAAAFALALRETRDIDPDSPLQDALYVEKMSRLLPTYGISSQTPDEVVLGFWLTGGASVPVSAFRRLHQMISWMPSDQLRTVVETAGFRVDEIGIGVSGSGPTELAGTADDDGERDRSGQHGGSSEFELPGRPELESFFNEHVVDIVVNRERYEVLGIGFPSAIVLHGPPGTGKTFAVERLIDFLGWPSFQIDASSVASPYIHETSKKVSQVFEQAIDNAPSVLVIDEMEAFLADRASSTGHHRVEEVAEFLRRIPEAVSNDVLIVAMTNRIELIDSAILRRGRFDHVIEVGYATESEVLSLLDSRLAAIPTGPDVDPEPIAESLANRPLSDVAFAVREAARLAARNGRRELDQESLLTAAGATPTREGQSERRRVGFV